MRTIVKAGLAVVEDGRLLLVREQGEETLFLPGGKPEAGETLEAALAREIREELGAALVPGSVRLYQVFKGPAANRPDTTVELHLFFGALASSPEASGEIAEIVWFGVDGDWSRLSPIARYQVVPQLLTDRHFLRVQPASATRDP
jgi:ADP-ribose pyrophosphatase YjhB (NUDIX family)